MRGITDINFAPECLLRAKNPVPRITEARQDIAVAVELAVDGCGVDRHVRVRLAQRLDAFGAGQQADLCRGSGRVGGAILPYLLLVLVLIFRPRGLLGARGD